MIFLFNKCENRERSHQSFHPGSKFNNINLMNKKFNNCEYTSSIMGKWSCTGQICDSVKSMAGRSMMSPDEH